MARAYPTVSAIVVFTVAWGASTASAVGPEIRWSPVAATDNVICLPGQGDCGEGEILLTAGGVTVTLFLELSAWDTLGGGHPGEIDYFLGAFQGTVDSATYAGGYPGNPGTVAGFDLNPLGQDTGKGFEGAFQALVVCSDDEFTVDMSNPDIALSNCWTGPTACPPEYPYCVDRPDYAFYHLQSAYEVSTATADYSWSAASTACREDPRDGRRFYGGTLILEIPAGAKGSYGVNFIDNPNFTLMNGCLGPMIQVLNLTPAWITIQTGRCCFGNGTSEQGCEDGLTQAECYAMPPPICHFGPGYTCADGCLECVTDAACGDGNACTNDVCDECSYCQRSPNYVIGVECCDSAGGEITLIDDGEPCTDDMCNPSTGDVSHEWQEPCPGRCCYGYGEASLSCDGELTKADCDAIPGSTVWTSYETCSGDDLADCTMCTVGMCDDGDPCTNDNCDEMDGSCTNWLSYTEGAECCAPLTGEVAVINDGDPCTTDACDALTGDVTHERVAPGTDCIAAYGPRYIAVSPAPGTDPIGLLVTGDSEEPLVSCVFGYVQADGTLGLDPVYQLPENWGTVDIHAYEIIPDAVYNVQIDDGTSLSNPVAVRTWMWADVNNDTFVNVSDIQLIVLGIQAEFLFASLSNLDLIGAPGEACMPQGILNVSDLQVALLCIKGTPYADLDCPRPCP